MGHDVRVAGEGIEECFGDIAWFEGAEPDSGEARNFGEFIEKFGQGVFLRFVPEAAFYGFLAESTEKNPGQDDFLMAGVDEVFCLFKDDFRGFAVNMGAGFGYYTVCAACVAAILDFQEGPCMVRKRC